MQLKMLFHSIGQKCLKSPFQLTPDHWYSSLFCFQEARQRPSCQSRQVFDPVFPPLYHAEPFMDRQLLPRESKWASSEVSQNRFIRQTTKWRRCVRCLGLRLSADGSNQCIHPSAFQSVIP